MYSRTGHLPWIARHLCGDNHHQLLETLDPAKSSSSNKCTPANTAFCRVFKTACCCCCKQLQNENSDSALSENQRLQINGDLQLSRRWPRTYSTMSRVNRFSTALDSAYGSSGVSGGSRRLDRSMSCYGTSSALSISALRRSSHTHNDGSKSPNDHIKRSSGMTTLSSARLNHSFSTLYDSGGQRGGGGAEGGIWSNKDEARCLSDVRLNNLRQKYRSENYKDDNTLKISSKH